MCLFKKTPALKTLVPTGTISINAASSLLLDKLDKMGDNEAELYLPDKEMKFYTKSAVQDFLSLDETDKIVYVAEEQDCDDFAAELFGKGLGLVWTIPHALNWFISENMEIWFVEPQTDKLSQNLEGCQGNDIRFFLGR